MFSDVIRWRQTQDCSQKTFSLDCECFLVKEPVSELHCRFLYQPKNAPSMKEKLDRNIGTKKVRLHWEYPKTMNIFGLSVLLFYFKLSDGNGPPSVIITFFIFHNALAVNFAMICRASAWTRWSSVVGCVSLVDFSCHALTILSLNQALCGKMTKKMTKKVTENG